MDKLYQINPVNSTHTMSVHSIRNKKYAFLETGSYLFFRLTVGAFAFLAAVGVLAYC